MWVWSHWLLGVGDFTLDTIDAKSGSESAFGKVARQRRQVCVWGQFELYVDQ